MNICASRVGHQFAATLTAHNEIDRNFVGAKDINNRLLFEGQLDASSRKLTLAHAAILRARIASEGDVVAALVHTIGSLFYCPDNVQPAISTIHRCVAHLADANGIDVNDFGATFCLPHGFAADECPQAPSNLPVIHSGDRAAEL